jgi:alanine racemase
MLNSSYLVLNQKALRNNIDFIKQHLCQSAMLSCVIKGNAYGHGIKEMVPLLELAGVSHFSVFSASEAHEANKYRSQASTIMVMGDIDDDQLKWIIEAEIEFYIFNFHRLELAIKLAKLLNKKALIHIEVETGMNRLGFNMLELNELIELIKLNAENLILKGICTHYAGAESLANHPRVIKQIERYHEVVDLFHQNNIRFDYYHSACSAAALRFPETRKNLIRVGILQYGFWPNQETQIAYQQKNQLEHNPLKRVISWRSRVMSIKQVESGEFVGYGTSYQTSEAKTIAIVAVGYSNGFSRALSNHGRVIIRGVRASVIGIVNMNAICVDISNINNVTLGDEVILIGKQGEAEISVASFGDFSDQLNYEVLARLPKDIPRIIN